MKKILLATTVLVGTAGFAAAEISLGGSGRFGLDYAADRPTETLFSSRLQFDINASTETDSGVTIGGKLRMRNEEGDNGTAGNNAIFTVSTSGLTVEFGNVNTAFDSVALTYASEMGFLGRSIGDGVGSFFAYNSQNDPSDDYVGISAKYSFGSANVYLSYINPDQYNSGSTEEIGVAADYNAGAFTVAGAYTSNGAGIDGNDIAFIGAAYAVNDSANVGLNYYDYDLSGDSQVTVYGNYTMGATTLRGYISDLDSAPETAYGLGADYALGGGVALSGAIHSDFGGDTLADLGLTFSF